MQQPNGDNIQQSNEFLAMLDWVPPEYRPLLSLVLIIAVILLIYLFRQEIGGLITRITEIEFDKNKGIRIKISENLQKAKQQKDQNAQLTGINRTGIQPDTDRPSLSDRDLVLAAWVSLKQNIYDVAVAQKVKLTVATSPLEALGRLKSTNVISTDQHDHIALLMVIGRYFADSTILPNKKDAVTYHDLVYDVLDWMMVNAFSVHSSARESARENPVSLRKTQVVTSTFPSPSPGKPAVKLIAIDGPQMGKQFKMEKMVFTIGRDSSNDLQVVDDNSVSNVHAQLRYDMGNILLSDMNSTNGTFLNEMKLKDSPMYINAGDKIKVGHSIFELR